MTYADKTFKVTVPYAKTANLIIFKISKHPNMIIIDTHYPNKLKDTYYLRDERQENLVRIAEKELIKCCARWSEYLEYNTGLYKKRLLEYFKDNLK